MIGKRRRRTALALIALGAVLGWAPARAETDEAAVRTLIANWYAELRKGKDARPWRLMAPGAMILPRPCPDQCGPLPRVAKSMSPSNPHYLAVQAQKFTHEVEKLRVERTLARADVWERGFRYAWALKKTTQRAAAATFIMEKREGEGWKILVYRSLSRTLRPKDKNGPLPDLRPDKTR